MQALKVQILKQTFDGARDSQAAADHQWLDDIRAVLRKHRSKVYLVDRAGRLVESVTLDDEGLFTVAPLTELR